MQGQSWRDRQFHAGDEPAADSPVRLAVGERIPVRAAWLGFSDVIVERLDQTCERMSESKYRYQSGKGSFILDTNPVGFVTQYPGQWELEKTG